MVGKRDLLLEAVTQIITAFCDWLYFQMAIGFTIYKHKGCVNVWWPTNFIVTKLTRSCDSNKKFHWWQNYLRFEKVILKTLYSIQVYNTHFGLAHKSYSFHDFWKFKAYIGLKVDARAVVKLKASCGFPKSWPLSGAAACDGLLAHREWLLCAVCIHLQTVGVCVGVAVCVAVGVGVALG